MAAGLTFLVMRQVMPMAAGLASGFALSSFGVVSAALAWGLGSALRGSGQFARGLTDRDTNRFDPLARRAGYGVRRGVMRARPWVPGVTTRFEGVRETDESAGSETILAVAARTAGGGLRIPSHARGLRRALETHQRAGPREAGEVPHP